MGMARDGFPKRLATTVSHALLGSAANGSAQKRREPDWTKLISQLSGCGKGREALTLYASMRDEGVLPTAHAFVSALKACSSIADLESGKSVHAHVIRSAPHPHPFLANTLIDMYAKCGCIEMARLTFDKMSHRTTVSWNAIMRGYLCLGMGDVTLQLYECMQGDGFVPNARTFVFALKACGILAARDDKSHGGKSKKEAYLDKSRDIHGMLADRGFESNMFISSTLVDVYAKCGSIEDARSIFEAMTHRNAVAWTAMIIAYAEVHMGRSALQLYARMQDEGFTPDSQVFVAALKACASLAAHTEGKDIDGELVKSCLEQGRKIHTQLVKRGFESNIFVANTLVDMYAKCGSIEDAHRVFENMKHRSVVSWTAMILGYSQIQRGDIALDLYACMQHEGFTADAHTFVAALKACGSLAMQQQEGGLYNERSSLDQGREIHAELAKRGLESEVFIANTLVVMYMKCGSIEDAWQTFEKMTHRNMVTWNAMIIGYAQMERGDLALDLFARMQREGFTPDAYTFVATLKACSCMPSLETGKEIHSHVHRVGMEDQSIIANCLVDMYCKCGSVVDAQQFFDTLLVRNSITWNALIAGYSDQGDSKRVFVLYKRMQSDGIDPDGITFISILSVCNHNGLVHSGQLYFQVMLLEYGICPSTKHYMCLVDLLGRTGQLDEAVAIVKKIPFQPAIVTWMIILGACQKWKHVEIARNAFECAVTLDEKLSSVYMSMINIYVAAQMWEESTKVQERRNMALA